MKKNVFQAFSIVVLVIFAAVIPACYYDNEEELYGTTPGVCDTVAVKYSTVIKPLLDNNCTTCHSAAGSQSDILLESYDQVKAYVNDNALVTRTNDTNNPMPPVGLMSECDRNKIKAWVKAGAPNN